MGLLKHVVIPIFTLIHIWFIYMIFISTDIKGGIELFQWPAKAGNDQSLTLWELHLFGLFGAVNGAFLVACLLGLLNEHAHFRAIVGIMEAVYWGIVGYDDIIRGFSCGFALGLCALAITGVLAQTQEPGLFTKDKKTKSS